jgi:hypothetical protein
MKRIIHCAILSLLCCFVGQRLNAQDLITDNKSGTLFTMPSALVSPKIAPNSLGFTYPFHRRNITPYYSTSDNQPFVDGQNEETNTMIKSTSLFFKVTVSNSTANAFDFSKYFSINPHLEFGISRSIDQFQDVRSVTTFYGTWSASVFADYQNFHTWDTTAVNPSQAHYGKIAPGAKFIFNGFVHDWFAVATSATYQYAVNIPTLKAYQQIATGFYSGPAVASNGSVAGYFGPVNADNLIRLSLTIPILAIPSIDLGATVGKKLGGSVFQFVPAPYYYATLTDLKGTVAHDLGMTLNILPYQVYNKKNWSFSSAFNIGYNLMDTNNRNNQRYVFLAGTFSFGSPSLDTNVAGVKQSSDLKTRSN